MQNQDTLPAESAVSAGMLAKFLHRKNSQTLEGKFAARCDELVRMRNFIMQVCMRESEICPNRVEVQKLMLAVNEVATNIIKHGFDDEFKTVKPAINFKITITNQCAAITLSYAGKPFMPGVVSCPKSEKLQQGGYGLFIAQALSDHIYYRPARSSCEILIIKQIAE